MKKPTITQTHTTAQSKWFRIESVEVCYPNQQLVTLERIHTPLHQAVIIAPIIAGELLLVKEYMVGIEQIGWTFPKGKVDPGETPLTAAQRELQEEVGLQANQLHLLKVVDSMPGYIQHETHLFIAQDLTPVPQQGGDEPEILEQLQWPIHDYQHLLHHNCFTDARNVATLMLAIAYLNNQ